MRKLASSQNTVAEAASDIDGSNEVLTTDFTGVPGMHLKPVLNPGALVSLAVSRPWGVLGVWLRPRLCAMRNVARVEWDLPLIFTPESPPGRGPYPPQRVSWPVPMVLRAGRSNRHQTAHLVDYARPGNPCLLLPRSPGWHPTTPIQWEENENSSTPRRWADFRHQGSEKPVVGWVLLRKLECSNRLRSPACDVVTLDGITAAHRRPQPPLNTPRIYPHLSPP